MHPPKRSWKEDLAQIAYGRRQSRHDGTAGGRHCQGRRYTLQLCSSKQIFDQALSAIFKNVQEYTRLTLVHNAVCKGFFAPDQITQHLLN